MPAHNAFRFDAAGYDRNGYNASGYNRSGFNASGYNSRGFDRNGYDRNGYDRSGYNRDGYNASGFNRRGRLASRTTTGSSSVAVVRVVTSARTFTEFVVPNGCTLTDLRHVAGIGADESWVRGARQDETLRERGGLLVVDDTDRIKDKDVLVVGSAVPYGTAEFLAFVASLAA